MNGCRHLCVQSLLLALVQLWLEAFCSPGSAQCKEAEVNPCAVTFSRGAGTLPGHPTRLCSCSLYPPCLAGIQHLSPLSLLLDSWGCHPHDFLMKPSPSKRELLNI